MKMSPEILTRLLRGEHFDMDQRRALDLLPTETLRYSELRDHLSRLLQAHDWFPRSPVPSEAIYVHRRAAEEYECLVWPGHGQKTTERSFAKAQDAADFYLTWELHLPGSLDTWPVIDDR